MTRPCEGIESKQISLKDDDVLTSQIIEHVNAVNEEKIEYEDPDSSRIHDRIAENETLRNLSNAPQGHEILSRALKSMCHSVVIRAEKISVTQQELNMDRIVRKLLGVSSYQRHQQRGLPISSLTDNENQLTTASQINDCSNIDWKSLGKQVGFLYQRPPCIAFMRGPIRAPPKPSRSRTRTDKGAREEKRSRTENGNPAQPTLVDPSTGLGQAETDRKIQNMCNHIRLKGAMNFFELIVDRTSFAKTVENIFHLSFLIKDGKVAVTDQQGSPWIRYANPTRYEEAEKSSNGNGLYLLLATAAPTKIYSLKVAK
eukprot:jgi/Galph1/3145/GphlegSOOS_G1762.1